MFFWSVLLFIHMLLAVALLGAVTHQAVSVCWPSPGRGKSFVASFRGVNGMTYTNAIIILFLCTAVLGAYIYPNYRVNVRPALHQLHFWKPEGSFELKEHSIALGAALLPAYWYFWRNPSNETRGTRTAITILLALVVWWAFMVGHVINNIRGFES